MLLSDFDYFLPSDLIAQNPPDKRHNSKLMIVLKKSKKIIHSSMFDIDNVLSSDYVIVVNNTKVFPARLYGKKETGANVEILLIKPVTANSWEAMVKPYGRLKKGNKIRIYGWNNDVVVGDDSASGRRIIEFGEGVDPYNIAWSFGKMPLPPYIKRKYSVDCDLDDVDKNRYQSLFALHDGSVAAPTASLHFSDELILKIKQKGIDFIDLTLHVGPGTFMPVKTDVVEDHKMEPEYFCLSSKSADKINHSLLSGKKILPVGTTVVRALESSVYRSGSIVGGNGNTDLFIYPGYEFKLVKSMITNFHLPKSTLLMLVCALGGYDLIISAYKEAVAEKYRFYSYGDAMLILDE